ncbi:MAG: YdjY domain-containing protein [bacterium]
MQIRQRSAFLFIISATSVLFCLFFSAGYSASQGAPDPGAHSRTAPGQAEKNPSVQQIGPDEFRIGKVILNKSKREIYLSGQVNMQSGLVEYLACWDEIGKLHESVLKLEARPSQIQVALLLLGLKYENNLKFQGDPAAPKGDSLEIWAEWDLPDKTRKKVRGEELVYDQMEKKPMDKTFWAFTGSQVIDGKFIADSEGSIIATFRDPVAIINNPLPNGADDTVYTCNEKILPPVGTNILLTMKVTHETPPVIKAMQEIPQEIQQEVSQKISQEIQQEIPQKTLPAPK